ncbi:MAG TPA: prepilin-type N-terminal cleavage/methylation domain-containing protein [Candidatus Hydrogenedentes bacterium]|nr:prepilin-type N-terminal cleavage/methylation domain-containing protein [Candidatus Hydrogenedentota bacterium]
MGDRRGFTLLEVLVALTILVIGILAVFLLFPGALTLSRAAAERRSVSEEARSVLGQARAAGAPNLMKEKFEFLDSISPTAEPAFHIEQYTAVQRLRGAGPEALQRVTFTAKMGDDKTETFVTYVARY